MKNPTLKQDKEIIEYFLKHEIENTQYGGNPMYNYKFNEKEAEIRKPLEDEIELLKGYETDIRHKLLWRLWFTETQPTQDELWEFHTDFDPNYCCAECGYFGDATECEKCGSDKIILSETREQFEIGKIKEILNIPNEVDLIDLVYKLLQQERQKVISELEEWVEKQPKDDMNQYSEACMYLGIKPNYSISVDDLKQKLNQMKGGSNE